MLRKPKYAIGDSVLVAGDYTGAGAQAGRIIAVWAADPDDETDEAMYGVCLAPATTLCGQGLQGGEMHGVPESSLEPLAEQSDQGVAG